jgi:hypothetical protein
MLIGVLNPVQMNVWVDVNGIVQKFTNIGKQPIQKERAKWTGETRETRAAIDFPRKAGRVSLVVCNL